MSIKLYLGSGSPRRVELLTQMNIPFEQRVIEVDEVYASELKGAAITDYLAKLKGKAQQKLLQQNEIVLTADTIVWHNDVALGKPKDEAEAIEMLMSLSGKTHEVISSVCLTTVSKQTCVNAITKVTISNLSKAEITHYVKNFKPLDKAGAYGIQEWVGHIGVVKIEGAYTNVVGLPTHKTYTLLKPYFDNVTFW